MFGNQNIIDSFNQSFRGEVSDNISEKEGKLAVATSKSERGL